MKAIAFVMVLSMALLSTAALADVPGLMSYQGTLTDDQGVALDTTVSMTFSIYTDSTVGSKIWYETQPSVAVSNGLYNVLLGRVTAIPDSVFNDPERWLGVQVGVDPELTPRQRIAAVGYAFQAANATSDGDWTISGNNMYSAVPGSVGVGTSTPSANLHLHSDVNTELRIGHGDWKNTIAFYRHGDPAGYIVKDDDTRRLRISAGNSTDHVTIVETSGHVGIGTVSPVARLHLDSDENTELRIEHGDIINTISFYNSTNRRGYIEKDDDEGQLNLSADGTSDQVTVLESNGNMGIGTLTPAAKLDVVGTVQMTGFGMPTGASYDHVLTSDSSGVGTWQAGPWIRSSSHISPINAPTLKIYNDTSAYLGLSFVSGTETPGITFWQNDGALVRHCFNDDPYLYGLYTTASSALNDLGVLAYGQEMGGYFTCGSLGTGVKGESYNSSRYGELGTPDYGVYGQHEDGNFGYIGGDSYGVFADLVTTVVGDYAIYGIGTDAAGEDGDQYQENRTLGGVKGYCHVGNPFTFGVAGFSGLDYNRSGGCFGAHWSGANWGCLSYRNSSGNFYGGYFTSDTTALGGKSIPEDNPASRIGLGSWGELFGADIHGQVYGIYAEGGNYALYSNGDVFTNGMDVHLQETETSSMAVLYTNVSTDVTVQTSGFSTLSKGICQIEFDDDFKKALSPDVPVVVTVTPTGNSNGVYVSEVTKSGFTVVENNGGKSDVSIAFIAIGRRAGYEHPNLPPEVISSDYVFKLSRGLHNDGDTSTEGEGLYFESGELKVGKYPMTLPGSN